jgi:hypothetical protein
MLFSQTNLMFGELLCAFLSFVANVEADPFSGSLLGFMFVRISCILIVKCYTLW